jgi:hypothetical protein
MEVYCRLGITDSSLARPDNFEVHAARLLFDLRVMPYKESF